MATPGFSYSEFALPSPFLKSVFVEESPHLIARDFNSNPMIYESELRENMYDLLQGETSIEEFAEWLSQARTNMHLDSAPEAQDLASAASLLLYEYFDDLTTEERLRAELTKLVEHVRVVLTLTAEHVRPTLPDMVTATGSRVFAAQPLMLQP